MPTVISLFAGVGGLDLALAQTGAFTTVYANDLDKYAEVTYNLNHPVAMDRRDIASVQPDDIPDADGLVGGFPCQPFSVAGKRQGVLDAKGRGTLFWELLRIVQAKKPEFILLENVKNLLHIHEGMDFESMLQALREAGYHCTYAVLSPHEYGNTPQHRERVFIVGFRDQAVLDKFHFPGKIPLTAKVSDIVDRINPVAERYYYHPGQYQLPVYETVSALTTESGDRDAIYQFRRGYARQNKSGLVPTLTANMGSGGHNVPLVWTAHGLRKLTTRECFRAQGFPDDFKLPDIADCHLYQQAGNSVCVPVVRRIGEEIAKALA